MHDVQKGSFPLGLPAAYFRYLEKLDSIKEIKTLNLPTLIMQGQEDYQVTVEDYMQWKQNLGKLGPRAELRLYPHLNHFFAKNTESSSGDVK